MGKSVFFYACGPPALCVVCVCQAVHGVEQHARVHTTCSTVSQTCCCALYCSMKLAVQCACVFGGVCALHISATPWGWGQCMCRTIVCCNSTYRIFAGGRVCVRIKDLLGRGLAGFCCARGVLQLASLLVLAAASHVCRWQLCAPQAAGACGTSKTHSKQDSVSASEAMVSADPGLRIKNPDFLHGATAMTQHLRGH